LPPLPATTALNSRSPTDQKGEDTTSQSQSSSDLKSIAPPVVKRQWQASFAHDPLDLTHLPKPIVLKTRRILAALDQGTAPSQLQGKRFNFDRTLLRIPVSYRYRLLCRWESDRIVPLQVLTHEAYNAIARNKSALSVLRFNTGATAAVAPVFLAWVAI
jgi:hypothetical protein